MKLITQEEVYNCIVELVESSEKPVSWEKISQAAIYAGFKETKTRDWMFVRGALQMAKDSGRIKRTHSIFSEEYERASAEKNQKKTYILTENGHYFCSLIDLDTTKLTENTQIFDTVDALYAAAAQRFDLEPDEIYGSEYTIVSRTQFSCDRGFRADFNAWDEGTEMPTPEQFLNDFVL